MAAMVAPTQTPKLIVHHLHIAQSERIPWLCEELGLPYTLVTHTRAPLLSPPELAELHPLSAAPLLVDATFTPSSPLTLAESGAIATYLIHIHGRGRLALPPSHPDYASYLYWFHFSNSNLQVGISRLLGLPPSDPRYDNAKFRLERILRHVDERLRGNVWLAGGEFTAADVMSVWCFTGMRMWVPYRLDGEDGNGNGGGRYEGILGWLERCTAREGYKRAMAKAEPWLDLEALRSVEGPGMFGPLREMYEGQMRKASEKGRGTERVKSKEKL